MSPIEGLSYGLSIAFVPTNLLAALVGVLLGTLVGVLPVAPRQPLRYCCQRQWG